MADMEGSGSSSSTSLQRSHEATSAASVAAQERRLRFQAGGTLAADAFYIQRPADEELPAALMRGELCYVLTTRQMGKSSLRVRVMARLEARGVACAAIDLTVIGTDNATVDTWYYGLASEIAEQLDLDEPDELWDDYSGLGPVHCFSRYLEDEVLGRESGSGSDSEGDGDTPGRHVVVFHRRDRCNSIAAVSPR